MNILDLMNSKGRVYVVLLEALRSDPTDAVLAPVPTLAEITGLHPRSVRRAVRELEQARLIATTQKGPGKPLAFQVIDRPFGSSVGPDGSRYQFALANGEVSP